MISKKFQLISFGMVILIGFLVYSFLGFPLHFFNHFFIGISAGILILILLSLIKIKIQKFELIIPFLLWIYSIIPEFIMGQHAKWTNIFLFHFWLDKLLDKSVFTLIVLLLIAIGLFITYLFVRKIKFRKSKL